MTLDMGKFDVSLSLCYVRHEDMPEDAGKRGNSFMMPLRTRAD